MAKVLTRKDQYLAYLAGNTGVPLPEPVTHVDMYLAYISGRSDIVLPEPVTREEQYYACIAGNTEVVVPKPIARREMYLAYWAGNTDVVLPTPITLEEILLNAAANQMSEPIEFHVRDEEGRLIILGAYKTVSKDGGLYIDCEPEADPDVPVGEWEYPVLEGNVLTITQVYSATLNGNVLEVE